MPLFLNTEEPDFEARFQELLAMKREDAPDVNAAVADIIADVRDRGDAALIEYTSRFDRLDLTAEQLVIQPAEIDEALARASDEELDALSLASERIRAYHQRQLPADEKWTDPSGAMLGWRWTPVSAAGLYVPGGLASYPSSVLMNAIPASVAGVAKPTILSRPTVSAQNIGPLR